MIEETDTDIEVRKYTDAQAARDLGIELYPSLAGTSINPVPTTDIDQYFADLGAAVDATVIEPATSVAAGLRLGAQQAIDSTVDFLGSEASKFFQYGGFGDAIGMDKERQAELYRDMELNTRKHLNERGLDTELPLSSLQPDTEIGIGIREMTAYVSNFLLGRPQFTKVKGLGDSVLDTVGDWGYRLLSNVRANSLGAHALSPEESNLSQLAVEMGFVQELNDFYAEGSVADRMSESVADRIAMTANPSVRGMDLDAEQRLLRKVDTIVEDNAAAGVLTGAIMTAAKAFKMAKANPKTTGAVVGGAAMAPEDGETSPLSAAGRAAKPAMSTADNMGGAVKAADNAADLDDLGFFSQAQRAAEGLGMDSGTGEQFLAMLKKAGVKEDELKWTGLDQVLAKDRVTKQEIIDHIADNRVEINETVLTRPEFGQDEGTAIFEFDAEPEVVDDADMYEFRAHADYEMFETWLDNGNTNLKEYFDDNPYALYQFETMAQNVPMDRYDRIVNQIQTGNWENMDATDRAVIEDAMIEFHRNDYMEDPFVRYFDAENQYYIEGSRDVGWRPFYPNGMPISDDYLNSLNEARVQIERAAVERGEIGEAAEGGAGGAQWHDYTQPGGSNYREVLLSLSDSYTGDPDRVTVRLSDPEKQELTVLSQKMATAANRPPGALDWPIFTDEDQRRFRYLSRKQSFKSMMDNRLVSFDGSHYDTPNLVVHARMSDRNIADGSIRPTGDYPEDAPKVLYIEELQSDWAQRGRIDGFFRPEARMPDEVNEEIISHETKFLGEVQQLLDLELDPRNASISSMDQNIIDAASHHFIRQGEPGATRTNVRFNRTSQGVARAIIEFHAGTDAAKSAQKLLDLYDERKAAEGIAKGPFVDSTEKWVTLAMKRILRKAVEEGYDYVAWTPGDVQVDRWRTPGLKAAYDKVIPKTTQKLLDRIDKGTKLEVIQLDIPNYQAGSNQPPQDTLAIPITDAMRAQAPGGLPLFSGAGAAVVGGGAAVSQRKGDDRQMEMQF